MAPTLPARWFVLGFIIVMVLVGLFSISTFSRVKQNAAIADDNLHVIAWALLLHADRHGEFPSDDSILIVEPWAGTLEVLTDDAGLWPASFDDANAGAAPERDGTWTRRVREALRTTRIQRPLGGVGPPRLDTPGFATLHGSVARVNGWLAAADERLSVDDAAPAEQP